jgi:prepilin-type N-terminal cleavage/methylation domain-containing protein
MSRGFTMIELIFVIVIIGILAVFALPKFGTTATKAKKSNYIAFMGTLNRTVAPAMWTDMLKTNHGSIKSITKEQIEEKYTQIPVGISLDLAQCTSIDASPGKVATIKMADSGLEDVVNIYCKDGTPTQAPSFGFSVEGNQTNATFSYGG